MPGLYELLNKDRVLCNADIGSKKRALQKLADLFADSDPELKARKVFDQFCARERLGSTGLGHGIAIPHCRMDGIDEPMAALITLDEPIEFDAADGKPLDLLVGLMVPSEATDTHLGLLADIAKKFSE
ncbi:MAG: PTS sugar transporter subunit IIA, partial [Granulosicoccaceae bacterium]